MYLYIYIYVLIYICTSFNNLSLQYSGIHSFSALVATFQKPSYVFSESSREQQLLLMFTNRAIATPITFRVSEGKVAGHCTHSNYRCMMFWEIWGKRTFCSFGFCLLPMVSGSYSARQLQK